MQDYDVVIIGAGGAGMMCAAEAGKRGRKVVLLDHSQKIGRKILISGGGRCNFTNIHCKPENFASKNPHFCKSALSRYAPDNFISLVKKHRIAFHEKKLGQLFCDGSAQSIVDLLIKECENANVTFRMNCKIGAVTKADKAGGQDDKFHIKTNQGTYTAESLVIATGGLSIPQIGATGFGYDIAKQFGLNIVEPFPALVGLNWDKQQTKEFVELAGVSIDTVTSCNDKSFRENILFTHTGLSGPAILQASLYWRPQDKLSIDLLPGNDIQAWLADKKKQGSKVELKNLLAEHFSKRFAEKFCALYEPSKPIVEYSDEAISFIGKTLHNWHVEPKSNVGYSKAEVTRGGVDTDELSSKTMEAKKVSGLYFIGEVVDVTGQLGGFNFQWAWASAVAAGEYV